MPDGCSVLGQYSTPVVRALLLPAPSKSLGHRVSLVRLPSLPEISLVRTMRCTMPSAAGKGEQSWRSGPTANLWRKEMDEWCAGRLAISWHLTSDESCTAAEGTEPMRRASEVMTLRGSASSGARHVSPSRLEVKRNQSCFRTLICFLTARSRRCVAKLALGNRLYTKKKKRPRADGLKRRRKQLLIALPINCLNVNST